MPISKFLSLTAIFLVAHTARAEPDRPNILIIMADDMGYSDIGCYGGEIDTPNIDQLAAGGMRFRQFYNEAKCGPSRAALLTGQFSNQGQLKNGATFAEILKSAGYRTLMAGKWHNTPMPTDFGFDRYYGLVDGCCNFFNPGLSTRPGEGPPGRKAQRKDQARIWGIEDRMIGDGYTPADKDFYTTDAFTDYAVARLEEYREEEAPFILYLAYTAPHYPLHAWPEDIEKYKDTYQIGWDKLRETRFERMREMGIIDQSVKFPERPDYIPAWDSLSAEEKEEQAYTMAVYAAMIDRMDQGIGKVLEKLRDTGKDENTLVIFLSDNGACAENPDSTPNIPPGAVESYRSVGRNWANASNIPFKEYKATSYEGGIRTPMIARWPGVVEPGGFSDRIGHLIDFLPTFTELAGATYPTEIRGNSNLVDVNGISLLPILKGLPQEEHRYLAWERAGSRAVRRGDWKLVSPAQKGEGTPAWELYHLENDPTESNDLVADHPEIAAELEKLWEEWDQQGRNAVKAR